MLSRIFNGRLVPGGLVHFYSFTCRARAGFRAAAFFDSGRRAEADESFWVSFFRGSRLETARVPSRERAVAPALRASGYKSAIR